MKNTLKPIRKILTLFLALSLVFVFTSCRTLAPSYNAANEETAITDTILTVKCFNVGKGDAFLLTTNNSAVMIDTGYKDNGEDLVKAIENSGHDHLDLLVISHFDKDHVGGAAKIIKNIPVDRIISTRVTNDNKRTVKFLEALKEAGKDNEVLSASTEISLDNVSYLISPPEKASYTEKEDNNSSLLVKVTLGSSSILFTGDAEDERLSEIIAADDLKSTILKLPHHGRFYELLPSLIDKVTPRYAIITASNEEPEDEETTSILNSSGVTAYNTRNGDITITMNEESVGISQ